MLTKRQLKDAAECLTQFHKKHADNVLVINFVTDMWDHMVVQKTSPKPP